MLTTPTDLYSAGAIDAPTWYQLSLRESKLAVDLETGAYLIASGGKGKGGSNKYYLIRVGQKRKTIRATSDNDAIAQANNL